MKFESMLPSNPFLVDFQKNIFQPHANKKIINMLYSNLYHYAVAISLIQVPQLTLVQLSARAGDSTMRRALATSCLLHMPRGRASR